MAYNYGGYYQPSYSPYQQYQQTGNGPIWVQGEAAAKSWCVQPGATVALWDSESQTIYLKSADASGLPSMKVLDYTVRDAQKPQESISTAKAEYVTKTDLDAVLEQINDLREEIDSLSIRKSKKKGDDE